MFIKFMKFLASDDGAGTGANVQNPAETVKPDALETDNANQKPAQTDEQNKAMAQLRRDAESALARSRKADALIAETYSEPMVINGKTFVIKTVEDYENALAESKKVKKLEEDAKTFEANPKLLERLDKLENDNKSLKATIDAKDIAEFSFQIDKSLKEVMEIAKKDGAKVTETELLTLATELGVIDLKKIYKNNFKPELSEKDIEERAVQKYIEGLKNGKGSPVEGKGSSATIVTEAVKGTKTDPWKGAREGALSFLKASRNQK
jgi:hypothetical protein